MSKTSLEKSSIKIAIVFGTRPELIKLGPVIAQISNSKKIRNENFHVISSGQHSRLLEDANSSINVKINFDLKLMKVNQSSAEFLTQAIEALSQLFSEEKYSIVLVHGDTGTAVAAAIAAHHCRIPVAHVEAGLRSNDIWAPWPEESNRRIIDSISTLHFAPTENSAQNLYREGHQSTTFITGNTIVDAVKQTFEKIDDGTIEPSANIQNLVKSIQNPLILVTQHRRENFGKPLRNILIHLKELAKNEIHIVLPVHPNPNVSAIIYEEMSNLTNVSLIDPLNYNDMVYLISKSKFIVTDSGGLQEEGPSLGIPVLVTRDKTERPEGIATGSIKLVGANGEQLLEVALDLLSVNEKYIAMSTSTNPYGDGLAAIRICKILEEFLFESHLSEMN
jgi:UDP-N-acetylglucosamine 2-epimerase (non-hydrolysing)